MQRPNLTDLLSIGAAVAGVALAARLALSIPGSPVPVTLQSFAVCAAALVLGPTRGLAAMLAYVGAAILGLPVLSDGRSGWSAVSGTSGGYLAGFVLAPEVTWAVGRAALQRTPTPWRCGLAAFLAALAAHALILGLGVPWLAWLTEMSPSDAAQRGAWPFLLGMLLKSAAVGALGAWWWTRSPPTSTEAR